MKTLFANNGTKNFNFAFDVLTSVELSLVKGGKDIDIYIDPIPAPAPAPMSTMTTDTSTTIKPTRKF